MWWVPGKVTLLRWLERRGNAQSDKLKVIGRASEGPAGRNSAIFPWTFRREAVRRYRKNIVFHIRHTRVCLSTLSHSCWPTLNKLSNIFDRSSQCCPTRVSIKTHSPNKFYFHLLICRIFSPNINLFICPSLPSHLYVHLSSYPLTHQYIHPANIYRIPTGTVQGIGILRERHYSNNLAQKQANRKLYHSVKSIIGDEHHRALW